MCYTRSVMPRRVMVVVCSGSFTPEADRFCWSLFRVYCIVEGAERQKALLLIVLAKWSSLSFGRRQCLWKGLGATLHSCRWNGLAGTFGSCEKAWEWNRIVVEVLNCSRSCGDSSITAAWSLNAFVLCFFKFPRLHFFLRAGVRQGTGSNLSEQHFVATKNSEHGRYFLAT